MRMTEEEFRALCASKHLNATIQAGKGIGKNLGNVTEPKKKSAKYRNRKVYVYASGFALYEKNDKSKSERLCMLNNKRHDLLEEIHDKENKLEDVDYLRFELKSDK